MTSRSQWSEFVAGLLCSATGVLAAWYVGDLAPALLASLVPIAALSLLVGVASVAHSRGPRPHGLRDVWLLFGASTVPSLIHGQLVDYDAARLLGSASSLPVGFAFVAAVSASYVDLDRRRAQEAATPEEGRVP